MMATIAAIIVAYNNQDSISWCLSSMLKQTEPFDQILVIDNASDDKTAQIIGKEFPRVPLLCNPCNSGYAAAANTGIDKTTADFVLIMNADSYIDQDFVHIAKAAIQGMSDQRIGIIAPLILDRAHRIDSTGLSMTWLRRFYDRDRGSTVEDDSIISPGYVFGASGACVLLRRSMLEDIRIGGEIFDEDFFVLCEDIDLAWRARRRGWRAWYCPALLCSHNGGISHQHSHYYQAMQMRNRYWLLVKNETKIGLLKIVLFCWIYELPRLVYMLAVNRYAMGALRTMIARIPDMKRKRKLIQ